MTLRTRQSQFKVFLSALLFSVATLPAWGASNFVRVPLGKGASIEVPKNWVVLSGNQRTTIDTFVEAKGYRQTESTLSFAANLYDDRGKTIALVNARFYPDNSMTQLEARQVTPSDLIEIDAEMRKGAEAALRAMGVRMLNWYQEMGSDTISGIRVSGIGVRHDIRHS